VLFWCHYEQTAHVASALRERVGGWATVRRAPFEPQGADVRAM
jgi:homoserine kinase